MNVLALIPARAGSKGIPNKNFTKLGGGESPLWRAVDVALAAGLRPVVTSDLGLPQDAFVPPDWIRRPAKLAQDDTPMIDVVKHALEAIPGPQDQIILLVQPSQPLRQPKHLKAAVELLEASGADSVVSVVELPKTHHPEFAVCVRRGRLEPWHELMRWDNRPATRQTVDPVFIPDGTVYAFRRSTVSKYDDIYGMDVRPLIIPPEETCALDTALDWIEAERRLRARE